MGSLCFPKQPFSPSLNTMQQWGYQVHAMVSSESIPWLWIIFHSARLFKLRNKATHYSLLQFLVDYQLSILWQTHQQETPIFFWLLDLSIWMTFFVTPQIYQLLPTVNFCVIFGVDLSHSHCPKPSFQCDISSICGPQSKLCKSHYNAFGWHLRCYLLFPVLQFSIIYPLNILSTSFISTS